jgi:hypothetical protein
MVAWSRLAVESLPRKSCLEEPMPRQYTRKTPLPVRKAIFPIGPSIAYIPLTQDMFSLVDWDDALILEQWNWYAYWSKGLKSYYAVRMEREGVPKRILIRMHRQITGATPGLVVDHQNHQTIDNRRDNIKICTQAENMRNIHPDKKQRMEVCPAATYWHNRDKQWRVRQVTMGKDKQLASFETKEEALFFRDRINTISGVLPLLNNYIDEQEDMRYTPQE